VARPQHLGAGAKPTESEKGPKVNSPISSVGFYIITITLHFLTWNQTLFPLFGTSGEQVAKLDRIPAPAPSLTDVTPVGFCLRQLRKSRIRGGLDGGNPDLSCMGFPKRFEC
jgi:hypothetical protein